MKMKTKKILFGLMAALLLVAVACETTSTEAEDELLEVGIDKGDVKIPGK